MIGQSRMRKAIFAVLFVVVAFIGINLFFVLISPSVSLKGDIIVSSTDDPQSPFLRTYAVHTDGSGYARAGENATSTGSLYTYSSDGSSVTFVGITQESIEQALSNKIPSGRVMQIYHATRESGRIPLVASAQQISHSDEISKKMPAISNDGAYVAYVTATSTDRNATSSIRLVSVASSSDTVLFPGRMPQWFTTHSFYYIAPDGIRLYDVSVASSSLVLPMRTGSNYKIAVSPSGKIFTFSNPDAQKVYFYTIVGDGLVLAPLKTLSMTGFWVVFSPDSRYIAVQTAESSSSGELSNPSLQIYDATTFKLAKKLTLGSLLNDRLFVTAWIQ